MDRGLGNYYRGNARRDERRYDEFYDRSNNSTNRRGGGGNFRGGSTGANRNRVARELSFFATLTCSQSFCSNLGLKHDMGYLNKKFILFYF